MRRSRCLHLFYRYFLIFSLIAFLSQPGFVGQTSLAAPAAPTWLSPSSNTSYTLQGVRYGAGEWLALGINNTIASSKDGKDWTVYHPDIGYNEWTDAVYDGSNWIVVGSGKIFQSPSGTAASDSGWYRLMDVTGTNLWGIAYGGGKYVAVGDNGTILTASNKSWWDFQILSGEYGKSLAAVIYANGKFVTVSSSGKIYTSTDGQSWAEAYSGSSPINGVTFGNGKFVAVGNGKAYTSSDGSNWSSSTSGQVLYSVDYGNNKFVAVGAGGTLATSTDGTTWSTDEQSNTTQDLYAVRYAPEQSRFVVIGDNGVVRTQSNMSDLSNMTLSAGTLTPAFAQATKTYAASVDTAVDQITVTLTPADSDATIQVNGNNAVVTGGMASTNVSLNPGANTIVAKVTSQDGSKQTDYTLTVTRAIPNASPTNIGLDKTTFAENAASGTLIGTLSATDTDSTVFTYSLVSGFGDNASFAIAGNQLKSNAIFDYETKNSYSIQIRVTDSGGASYDKIFTIQVTNVAEAPMVSNSSKSGSEDNPLSLGAADFTAAYADPEKDSMKKVQVTSLPDASAGTLKLRGTAVAANQEIDAADLSQLVFEPVANWNGSTSFTWKGNDGNSYSALATFTLVIAPIEDLPTVKNSRAAGQEDHVLAFVPANFSDNFTDVDGDSLSQVRIERLPANGVLKLNGNPVSAGQVIAASDLGALGYAPQTNWNGPDSFTWKASDGTGYSIDAATIDLTIAPENDPPTVTDVTTNGDEDKELVFAPDDFTAHFTDDDGDVLSKIQIVTLPAHGTLTVDGVAVSANQDITAAQIGKLRFVPDAEWSGSTSFTWKAYDGNDYSVSTANVIVNITAINDPPTMDDSRKNGIEETAFAFAPADFTGVYHDAENDSLQKVKIVSLPNHGTLLLNHTPVAVDQQIDVNELDELTFAPDTDWNGTTGFTWKGYDGVDYATRAAEMSIEIAPVNDLPTVSDSSKNGSEGNVMTFAVNDFTTYFKDVDGDALQKVQIDSLPTGGTLKLDGTAVSLQDEIDATDLRKLTFTPKTSGTTSFAWKGSDGSGYSIVAATLTLRIAPVIVIQPSSSDANLRGLSISGGTLKPEFLADQTSYSVEVGSDVTQITVTPIASHWAAAITVNGKVVASGTSETIEIKDGGADVQIVVTAQDGTTKTYAINISQGDVPITDIKLDKRSISLKQGDRPVQLKVSVKPAHASTKGLIWTSAKQEVATVDDTGTIVPLSVGTTTIRVSTPDGKISTTSKVTVKAGKIQELLAEPQMLVLGEGESESVVIKAFYGYETVKEIEDGIVWSSDDEEIATVTDGEIKAEAEGTTFVTASYKGKKVKILVKVIPVKFVDEAAVKAAFTPPGKGSTRYRLTVAGTLLTKESVTVQVKLGTKTYSVKIGKDRSFSLDRAMTWKGEIPDQIDVVIKSRKAGGKTQSVTIPLKTFDPKSIEVTEKGKGEYTISGDLLDPSLVAKVEVVTKDGEHYAGKVDDQQFVISLKNAKAQTVTVRVVLYSGFEQEAEVEIP